MNYIRLGKSGLRVSQIILCVPSCAFCTDQSYLLCRGCMSYGSSKWQDWVLDEDESIKHIEAAYNLGINAFDTADVYSHGRSEEILGKAIKQLKLPRDEIVVLTKVFFTLGRTMEGGLLVMSRQEFDKNRYVNVSGLSRKVSRKIDYASSPSSYLSFPFSISSTVSKLLSPDSNSTILMSCNVSCHSRYRPLILTQLKATALTRTPLSKRQCKRSMTL